MLIEVIVASAVAVILLVALLRVFGGVWDLNARVREETEAIVLARSVMEGAAQRSTLTAGAQAGQAGRYGWQVNVTEVAQAVPRARAGSETSSERAELSSGLDRAARTSAFANDADQGNPGRGDNASGREGLRGEADAGANRAWTLYRIQVAVLGPTGRRTNLETLRLGQPR